jgi:2-polyprenyl-3-methyl-5-hydroxy-6-metoxy-1,4-benzoquinol methylase
VFTSPRPTHEWFKGFYRDEYRQFYENVSDPDDEYVARAWIRPRHEETVDRVAPSLPINGRLLDVGCAEGTFLDAFRARLPGWEVHGVDPSSRFVDFALSHYRLENVRMGELGEVVNWPAESFDLLTANHLLEHLLDPNEFFLSARHLLREGGLVFVDVPDAEGCVGGINNLHIAHLYHFSQATMRDFFSKHGFTLEWVEKGREVPQWTFRALGRKGATVPHTWAGTAVNTRTVARAFRRRCAPPPMLKRAWSQVRRTLSHG